MNASRAAHGGLMGGLCLLLLQACAGSGQGLDANGRPIGESGGSGNVPLSADFSSLQANIFTPICSVCHIGGGAPEGLRLDEANAYNLLVGVPSTEVSSVLRVQAGDPDSSYLVQKLEGHAAVGARMPLGGPYLPASTIAFVRQWISNGAPPATAAAAQNTTLTVKAIVPDAQEPVSSSPPQVSIAFNADLDVTQLGGLAARIERLDAPESIAAFLSVPPGNAKVLLITPRQALAPGRYRLLMSGALGGATLSDVQGHTLTLGNDPSREAQVSTFDVEVLP